MTPLSPLQLKNYFFTHLSVHANPKGTQAGSLTLEPSISFQKNADTASQWSLAVRVILKSNDPQTPFPYEADISIQGLVEVHESFPAEKREQLAVVNGLGLLYSAIREMVLTVTARLANGPLCLPTLNFTEVVANKNAQEKLKESTPVSTQTGVTPSQK